MNIGVPKEQKNREERVSCTPAMAGALVADGHQVRVEQGAGTGSGFDDEQYASAGATLVEKAQDAWDAELVLKVKEPIAREYEFLRSGQMIFGYFHLAASKPLTERLMQSGATAIAMELIPENGRYPLLEPMSEIAGRMSAIIGAFYLGRPHGGRGVLLSGVAGVAPANVVVLGGGTAGMNAALMASGMGGTVAILDINTERLRELERMFGGKVRTHYSTEEHLVGLLPATDLLVGAVLLPGARAPRIVRRGMLRLMRPGSLIVDIAIDQGGCVETSRPTTHDAPLFEVDGVRHYCVTNMPAAYARTATEALTNASAIYVRELAGRGLKDAIRKSPGLAAAVSTHEGKLTSQPVAEAHGLEYSELTD